MNPQMSERTTSEDDRFALPSREDFNQARGWRGNGDWPTESWTDSVISPEELLVNETFTQSEGVEHFVGGKGGTGEAENRSTTTPEELAGAQESITQNPTQALYGTISDVFEGDSDIAELLRVSEEQIREWKRGNLSDGDALDRLENLSAVVSKLRRVYELEVIPDWIQGLNPHLGGSRPVDILVQGQLSRVIAAIEAERGGAHA